MCSSCGGTERPPSFSFLLPTAPLGAQTVSLSPAFPSLGHCFTGLSSPLSFRKSLGNYWLAQRPHFAGGKAEAQGLFHLAVYSHLWGGSKWLLALSVEP